MYNIVKDNEYTDIEEVCFDYRHIAKVVAAIKKNFDKYFNLFIESENNMVLGKDGITKLQNKFGVASVKTNAKSNKAKVLKSIIMAAIKEFNKNREKYEAIIDLEVLEEYEDNPNSFKDRVLAHECPIINSTLMNKQAKELDKYRINYKLASPNDLLRVVKNLTEFSNEYYESFSEYDDYDDISNIDELGLLDLDDEDYTLYGVIGGGIKSHLLYKIHPSLFSNRSRNAIWALWYLTNKDTFGCMMDSEFLMIDIKKSTTQQNYFYPYGLFAYYALVIYLLIKDKAKEMKVDFDEDYRYVLVDAFLEFIAEHHDDEIKFLKQQIRDGGMGFV